MSDHDRGGYAPHNEAPLAFDSYESRPRGRRPLPMALIGSAVVLVLLIAALVMFYLSGAKSAEGSPRPVGGGIASIKTAPAAGEPTDPAAGLEVYSPQNVPSGNVAGPAAPQFAPTPEQPLNRPAPPPSEVVAKPVARPAPPPHAQAVAAAPIHTVPATPPAKAAPEASAPARPKTLAHATLAPAAPVKGAAVKPPVSAKTSAPKPKAPPVSASDDEENAAAPVARAVPASDYGAITTSLAAKSKAAPKASKSVAETPLSEAPVKPKPVKTAAPKPKLAKAAPATTAEPANEDVAGSDATLPKGALSPTKPVPSAAPAAPKGGYVVQVGAFASAALADQGFTQASSKVSGAAGKSKHVETVQKDGKTYYRSTLRGFGSKSDAAAFCAALRAKGGQCIVRGGA